ncbi:senescence-associated protein SPA15, chloroplastic isoform X2 [Punica granatum]|uniref:Senescence-associated protein SPA15, chloroplastic isoform X2 n=1 Tax=Punica granatum TaxID=22663 RepID=A0A6P8DHX2_PUNGR|nr:senescence-associated protein SPA15, chloroplastic isoform X2 [Punica granatum]
MAFMAAKVPSSPIATHRAVMSSPSHKTADSAAKSPLSNHCSRLSSSRGLLLRKFDSLNERLSCLFARTWRPSGHRQSPAVHWSTRPQDTETKEWPTPYADCSDVPRQENLRGDARNEQLRMHESDAKSSQGLAEACRFIHNDAKFVNERARNDIVLLSRGIMRLDARARQDVAILGSEFLKLNARAREDTEKIDRNMKKKAERLHHIATILKNKAQSKLKTAADQHWSDGALEADLRLADFRAKQRAMEDALMALEFVKNIHDMMASKMYRFPLRTEEDSPSRSDLMGRIMLEKNGKALEFFPGEVSTDRITAIQEAYWSMASALSEADGIDYTDPEELELLITTLIDLDAMDGKSSVSLLAECSSSPDVNTRKALANALATAPSMWTLGNAGMGALQEGEKKCIRLWLSSTEIGRGQQPSDCCCRVKGYQRVKESVGNQGR